MLRYTWLFISLFISLFMSDLANARPVSYPGGWTSMAHYSTNLWSWHGHYSPTARNSIGYKVVTDSEYDYTLQSVAYNVLLKRWNRPASQANLYIKSGIGVATDDGRTFRGGSTNAGYSGFSMDWEDRRYFTSYESSVTQLGGYDAISHQSARVGIAPYIGDYGDLHTWIMLQVDQHSTDGPDLVPTVLIRLFKGINLVEFGLSSVGDVTLNWIYRY
ncbi:MAG: hypothetical protein O3A01_06005 [bacterium]|nr:hypothetical protein [bacterium]